MFIRRYLNYDRIISEDTFGACCLIMGARSLSSIISLLLNEFISEFIVDEYKRITSLI